MQTPCNFIVSQGRNLCVDFDAVAQVFYNIIFSHIFLREQMRMSEQIMLTSGLSETTEFRRSQTMARFCPSSEIFVHYMTL